MKQLNSEKSFTLTELLIVISIIGILMTVSFPYYRSARQQLALQRAASRLAQDIRRAQEMAMSVEKEEGCFDDDGNPKDDYKYGFGLVVSSEEDCKENKPCKDKYILYADCNGNRAYQPSEPDYDILLSNPDFDTVEVKNYSGDDKKLNIIGENASNTAKSKTDVNAVIANKAKNER